MSATVLVQFSVKDPDKFKQYSAGAGPTIKAVGGEITGRFRKVETLTGDYSGHGFALITFPDAAAVKTWYESAEYQALVALREEAVDMTLVLGEPLG